MLCVSVNEKMFQKGFSVEAYRVKGALMYDLKTPAQPVTYLVMVVFLFGGSSVAVTIQKFYLLDVITKENFKKDTNRTRQKVYDLS